MQPFELAIDQELCAGAVYLFQLVHSKACITLSGMQPFESVIDQELWAGEVFLFQLVLSKSLHPALRNAAF